MASAVCQRTPVFIRRKQGFFDRLKQSEGKAFPLRLSKKAVVGADEGIAPYNPELPGLSTRWPDLSEM